MILRWSYQFSLPQTTVTSTKSHLIGSRHTSLVIRCAFLLHQRKPTVIQSELQLGCGNVSQICFFGPTKAIVVGSTSGRKSEFSASVYLHSNHLVSWHSVGLKRLTSYSMTWNCQACVAAATGWRGPSKSSTWGKFPPWKTNVTRSAMLHSPILGRLGSCCQNRLLCIY